MSLRHICGFYFIPFSGNQHLYGPPPYQYIPQVDLKVHTTIFSTTSRTTLTQTFVNPSKEKGIRNLKYTFPLYDGVSVVGFTCHINRRIIKGEVKQKDKAKADYHDAVSRGETAGLLEQLPESADVFTTSIGNVPPGATIVVEITYLGELKHDAEVDGIRFTIPTSIAPRYGAYPGRLADSNIISRAGTGGIQITIDATVADGSFIREMRSPSHPIAVSMGTTSIAPNADPQLSKASATLSLGTAELDKDFILQLIAKDIGIPRAVLETHSTIPGQRALMATLVPRFSLPPSRPEVVFVCDRSGSMAGSKIPLVISALKVFLKSLPVGVKFNICSFGSNFDFLWEKSRSYDQDSLNEAIKHIETFSANYGGTEMFYPIEATINQRYKDIPLEIMLLTDGEIWDQQRLFTYLNEQVEASEGQIRAFTLGVGSGASHALIEGIARAGNGFSQAVADGEKLDSKIVRMLKGALSPHINDYSLEIKYADENKMTNEDDFEIIEKVSDSLKVKLDLKEEEQIEETTKKPISLFDTSVDLDKPIDQKTNDDSGQARYSHLPNIPVPNFLQTPHKIPTLFAFNRTTVYMLISPNTPQAIPKAVVLRGTSPHGPLELEIPVHVLDEAGETIHQLAARSAVKELEEGRGWITGATDGSGKLLRSKFDSKFDDMVEREAVRLGVQFQVGGKWCSFVAVEKKNETANPIDNVEKIREFLDDEDIGSNALNYRKPELHQSQQQPRGVYFGHLPSSIPAPIAPAPSPAGNVHLNAGITAARSVRARPSMVPSVVGSMGSLFKSKGSPGTTGSSSGLFGAPMAPRGSVAFGTATKSSASPPSFGGTSNSSSGLFGAINSPSPPPSFGAPMAPGGNVAFGTVTKSSAPPPSFGGTSNSSSGLFGASNSPPPPPSSGAPMVHRDRDASSLFSMHRKSSASSPFSTTASSSNSLFGAHPASGPAQGGSSFTDPFQALIGLQTFEGFWIWADDLFTIIGVDKTEAQKISNESSYDAKAFATALVILFFERKLNDDRDAWELVVDKARGWLESTLGEAANRDILISAEKLFT